jgi:hypothetical protein
MAEERTILIDDRSTMPTARRAFKETCVESVD